MVHFYSEEASFQDALSRFIGGALGAGDIAIVIATPDHRHGLAQRLRAGGLDTGRLVESGRYISLDARETLSNIMVDGIPDAERFDRVVKGVITRAEKAAVEGTEPRLAVYGEMVALLWKEGKLDAVLALEQLWNRLAESYSFSLRCGYPITSFRRQEDDEPFLRICASHSSVIPSESYTALTSEEERLRSIARLQQKEQVVSELARANENLRESEERFRLFVEGVRDYAIFMLDTSGCVMSWNAGAERIKGYRRDEIVGTHFSVFYPPESIQSGKPYRALEAAAAEGHFEDEGWRVRKDGSRFYASVVVTAVRDSQGRLQGFSKVTRDITERKRAEEAMREPGRLLQTRDEERRRLARELHDSTAQTLTALSLNLALIRELVDLAASPRALNAYAESIELARAASQEIRALSYLLHPPMLDEAGLPSALRWYVDGFVRRTKVSVELEVPSEVERLSTDVETALFRIAQECLANIHRHSRSTTASVRLLKHAGQITLEVADQGVGLPPGALRSNGTPATMGVGIRGMHERVRQLGGHLELKPGNPGTRVIAVVPLRTGMGRPNRTDREKQPGDN